MIPKTIQPYFKITRQTNNGDNSLIEGIITCCNDHDFDVFVAGKVKHSLFSKMFLCPENDEIIIEVRCKKCGKVISVFNSSCDGYGQYGKERFAYMPTKPIECIKCKKNGFTVTVKYEYSNLEELKELEIKEKDNAFTWIWITLACNNCGIRYSNFVDCETT